MKVKQRLSYAPYMAAYHIAGSDESAAKLASDLQARPDAASVAAGLGLIAYDVAYLLSVRKKARDILETLICV